MVKHRKVVDVNAPPEINDPVVSVVAANLEETTAVAELPPETDNEPAVSSNSVSVEPINKIVSKKPRAPRPKKEAIKIPEVVPEEPKEEPKEELITKVEIVEPTNKKVKTVELVECPKCHKQLTQRTLKYSHNAVCPANAPPEPPQPPPQPQPKQQPKQQAKPKRIQKPEPEYYEEEEQEVVAPPATSRIGRVVRRNEKYKHLIQHAF